MLARARARARVEGCRRGRATRKVLCRGAPELAGFTRAVTKHLLSLAAAPRSRLQARLLLVCYCLFFHRLLSSSFSFSSCSMHLPPRWAGALPLRSFWYRAASIWKRPHCSESRPSCLRLRLLASLLRLFAKRYSRYTFRQDSSMFESLIVFEFEYYKLEF